jgi:hypothetical protein
MIERQVPREQNDEFNGSFGRATPSGFARVEAFSAISDPARS